jgi:hypothetical protein
VLTWPEKILYDREVSLSAATFRDLMFFVVYQKLNLNRGCVRVENPATYDSFSEGKALTHNSLRNIAAAINKGLGIPDSENRFLYNQLFVSQGQGLYRLSFPKQSIVVSEELVADLRAHADFPKVPGQSDRSLSAKA